MRPLQFRHIEVFQAVVQRGTASSAARALGVTQPAVSKTIAQAEHLIGFSLFDRRGGKLVPTPRALQLYERCSQLFTTLDSVNDIVAKMAGGAMAPVSLGMVPLLAMTLLPTIVQSALIDRGHMADVITHDSLVLTNRVMAGQLEFALVSALPDVEGVESARLAISPTYVAVSRGHPLASRDRLELRDLEGEPFIGLSTSEALQTRLDLLLRENNVRPREVIRCPLMAGAVAMAEAGVGLTIADAFATRLARCEGLKFIPFTPEFSIEYRAIWPAGFMTSFGRKQFLSRCQTAAARMIAEAGSACG